ncbi:hypothetical protein pb186bvf_006616 [Paramecium bursaria]
MDYFDDHHFRNQILKILQIIDLDQQTLKNISQEQMMFWILNKFNQFLQQKLLEFWEYMLQDKQYIKDWIKLSENNQEFKITILISTNRRIISNLEKYLLPYVGFKVRAENQLLDHINVTLDICLSVIKQLNVDNLQNVNSQFQEYLLINEKVTASKDKISAIFLLKFYIIQLLCSQQTQRYHEKQKNQVQVKQNDLFIKLLNLIEDNPKIIQILKDNQQFQQIVYDYQCLNTKEYRSCNYITLGQQNK